MTEIIISTFFLILILLVFLRMIFLTLKNNSNNIFSKISRFYISKTDFIFSSLDSKINFMLGKIRLSYILIILLLMLLQKLLILIIELD